MFENIVVPPKAALDQALALLDDFQHCQSSSKQTTERKIVWMIPTSGAVKLNIDKALFPRKNRVGTRCVLRDNGGEVLMEATNPEPFYNNPL